MGNRLRETYPFLKQKKTKQKSPGEEKQGQRCKQGEALVHCRHLVSRCWCLPSAPTGEPKLFIFVQQLLSQSNMRCCLAALTVHACEELCGTSYNGADTCQACLAAVCWIGGWLHNVDAELYQCSSICKATGAASLAQLHSYGFLTSCLFIMWSSLIEGENIFCEFS